MWGVFYLSPPYFLSQWGSVSLILSNSFWLESQPAAKVFLFLFPNAAITGKKCVPTCVKTTVSTFTQSWDLDSVLHAHSQALYRLSHLLSPLSSILNTCWLCSIKFTSINPNPKDIQTLLRTVVPVERTETKLKWLWLWRLLQWRFSQAKT